MKVHVIFLALASVMTIAMSGCAFKDKKVGAKSMGSALSANGFSGTLSAIVQPSIQSVIPNAAPVDPGSPDINLTVIGINLGYRGLPSQPNLITAKPLLMSLGDGCECTSNSITASVLQTNQDSLSCTIPVSSCQGGIQNRTLTITRPVASGDPSTVTMNSAVQLLTNVPFQLGALDIDCFNAGGLPANNQSSGALCKGSMAITVNMTGGTGLTGGQLRMGSTVCPSYVNSNTSSFSCNFAAVCPGNGPCSTTSLPLIYAQAGYSINFGYINFVSAYTVTAITPANGSAVQANTIQITGTNLNPSLIVRFIKSDGSPEVCTYVSNTSTNYFCNLTDPLYPNKPSVPNGGKVYHSNVSSELDITMPGGLHPDNYSSTVLTYTVDVATMSATKIQVRKSSGFLESRVLAANISGGTQNFVITGTGFSGANPQNPVSVLNAANIVFSSPTCAVTSDTEINCSTNASTQSGFNGVRAAVFGLRINGNAVTRDLDISNVFEVLGKNKNEVEALTAKVCRSSSADCWVDSSHSPAHFSDMRPRVWNRYVTILFGFGE